ncbi:methyltransferase domain-containing protein [Candidatus Pelagibacter sp.]|nr:methyltransferase domain-containing protein [Candidatus Pelagibacter sp.]
MVKFDAKILAPNQSAENNKNKDWWNSNPMIYDWEKKFGEIKYDKSYFDKIDELFGEGHKLVNNPNWPDGKILENFIPYDFFKNKKVLELGCGAGLVSSHIAKSGANLHSIDLTDNAVRLTKKRFEILNLKSNIEQMDGENLSFDDNTFDYVVSWGVIHHSGNMEKVLEEIHRILKPGGEAYIMIYNRNSLRYRVYCFFWLGMFKLKFFKMNFKQIVGSITDGYIARHLNEKEMDSLTKKFNSKSYSYSDEVNTISMYLMGPFYRILYLLPKKTKVLIERFLAKKFGWYMEIVLKK